MKSGCREMDKKWIIGISSAVAVVLIAGGIGIGYAMHSKSVKEDAPAVNSTINGSGSSPTGQATPTEPKSSDSQSANNGNSVSSTEVSSTTIPDPSSQPTQSALEKQLRGYMDDAKRGDVTGVSVKLGDKREKIFEAYGKPQTEKVDFEYYPGKYAGYGDLGFLYDSPDFGQLFAIQLYPSNLVGTVTLSQVKQILGEPSFGTTNAIGYTPGYVPGQGNSGCDIFFISERADQKLSIIQFANGY
jgi:hypothetical protein